MIPVILTIPINATILEKRQDNMDGELEPQRGKVEFSAGKEYVSFQPRKKKKERNIKQER